MLEYLVERLTELIDRGGQLLKTCHLQGNIDEHDLWFAEAKNVLQVNAPEYLEPLFAVAKRLTNQLLERPYGRPAYDLIQQQTEVLKLARSGSSVLGPRFSEILAELREAYPAAYSHYEKSIRFLAASSPDSENAIKEIITAIESVGKTLCPRVSTLGDVIKELRGSAILPRDLAAVIEKFYAFTNSEPGIRHGSTELPQVGVEEAEFCMLMGVAVLRYLIRVAKPKVDESRATGIKIHQEE